jgi:hypothetical protein
LREKRANQLTTEERSDTPDFEVTIATTDFLNTWFETGDMWFPRLGLRLPKAFVCVNLAMVINDWSRTDRLAFQLL